jgi:hypothetical protein
LQAMSRNARTQAGLRANVKLESDVRCSWPWTSHRHAFDVPPDVIADALSNVITDLPTEALFDVFFAAHENACEN